MASGITEKAARKTRACPHVECRVLRYPSGLSDFSLSPITVAQPEHDETAPLVKTDERSKEEDIPRP